MADAPEGSRRNGSRLMGIAATFTAVVALIVAVWDNVETRRHNRLSVAPYVVLEHIRSDSGPMTFAEVEMRNVGVGPAVLTSLEISFPDGSGERAPASAWGEVADEISARGVEIRGWADVRPDAALGAEGRRTLLRIQASGEGSGERIQRVLDELRLRLRYESVYGDPAESTLGWSDE